MTHFRYYIVSGQINISLEVLRENKILIEANSIVRYLATTGSRPWLKSGEEALKDSALIEFEESGQGIKAADVAESVISKANFPTVGISQELRTNSLY